MPSPELTGGAKMPITDARRRATKKYREANCYALRVEINKKTESDIYEKLNSVENKAGYVKGLIRSDIAENGK